MKRSKSIPSITLVCTLSTVMPAAAQQHNRRDGYVTIEACIADWGTKDLCEFAPLSEERKPLSNTVFTYPPAHFFWGPWYYTTLQPVPQRSFTYTPVLRPGLSASRSIGTVSRSGFGVTGRSFSSSGAS